MPEPVCVVTTINPPTQAVRLLEARFPHRLVVIGDNKTPAEWQYETARFHSITDQKKMPFNSVAHTPENHYARKNLGYLQAMLLDAPVLYDTDDDNEPNEVWRKRDANNLVLAEMVIEQGWCNVYRFFHRCFLWPRGLPLSEVRSFRETSVQVKAHSSPIQQGLADNNPDVDAIWRLVKPQKWIKFRKKRGVLLSKGVWCPFNSQATWWWPEAYPLLYLPTCATFRMTDIWRSFVAQRCLWAMGKAVVFQSPSEVNQERNPHDLMQDFKSEIPGYIHNNAIAKTLDGFNLEKHNDTRTVLKNLKICYTALVDGGFLPKEELLGVDAWTADVIRCKRS